MSKLLIHKKGVSLKVSKSLKEHSHQAKSKLKVSQEKKKYEKKKN